MENTLALDPGSRIPDPPMEEGDLLQWARDITEKLRNDHADSVDRIENMIMSDKRTAKRPDAKGTKRMFYDQYTGKCYIDVLSKDGVPEWKPLNSVERYVSEDRGVSVLYTTSLPDAGLSSGQFEYDEETYDEASYWPGSGSAITLPEARSGNKKYQIQVLADISSLTADEEIVVGVEHKAYGEATWGGLDRYPNSHIVWQADAGGTKKMKLNFTIDAGASDQIRVSYNCTDTFTLDEMYTIVTPVILTEEGGSEYASVTTISHGDTTDLGVDDHAQYLLASDATNRATFAANWTDLTDGGSTTLHTHGLLRLDNDMWIYWRNAADGSWLPKIKTDAGDDLIVGVTGVVGEDTYLRGCDLYIQGTDNIIGTCADFSLTATNDAEIAADNVYVGAALKLKDNSDALQGRITSTATYYSLAKVDSSNRATLGNSSLNTWVEANAVLRLGRYEAKLYMEDSGSAWVPVCEFIGTNFTLGNIGKTTDITGQTIDITSTSLGIVINSDLALDIDADTEITMDTATDITITAGDDLLLQATDEIAILAGDSLRFSHTVISGAPSAANTDLSSGQWCIAYDGTNWYFCGHDGTFTSVLLV